MSNPQPGWYPDPNGAAKQRYWDGQAWTDHYGPAATDRPRDWRWLADRQDPRTLLLGSVVILTFGAIGSPFMLREGGFQAWFVAVWLTLAALMTIYHAIRVRRRSSSDR